MDDGRREISPSRHQEGPHLPLWPFPEEGKNITIDSCVMQEEEEEEEEEKEEENEEEEV